MINVHLDVLCLKGQAIVYIGGGPSAASSAIWGWMGEGRGGERYDETILLMWQTGAWESYDVCGRCTQRPCVWVQIFSITYITAFKVCADLSVSWAHENNLASSIHLSVLLSFIVVDISIGTGQYYKINRLQVHTYWLQTRIFGSFQTSLKCDHFSGFYGSKSSFCNHFKKKYVHKFIKIQLKVCYFY